MIRSCPLCRAKGVLPFAEVQAKEYFQCEHCRLVFLHSAQYLTPEEERQHYRQHKNHPGDSRYRTFLSRLTTPLTERLTAGMEGLDYGCGPGPTLSLMLQEQGFAMEVYDPFFAPEALVLERSYDFITCSEVVEHFHSPASEFENLNKLLSSGGWLAVMTEILQPETVFEAWNYRLDSTHVCFYRPQTMEWLAHHFDWAVQFPQRNVALFQKRDSEYSESL